MDLYRRHISSQWSDAPKTDMGHFDKYYTCKYLGKDSSTPLGYKKIWAHIVYDVNHDGRHKSRLVADGHLTDIPVESIYYGIFPSVVSDSL